MDKPPDEHDPRRVLTKQLQHLAGLRATRQRLNDTLDTLREQVEATKTWTNFEQGQQDILDISGAIEGADAETRETVMDVAAEIGIRKPVEGLEVIDRTTFQILDEDAALVWARDNMRAALVIDTQTFKKLLLAIPEKSRPDFVFVGKDPAVRISGDLSAYLDGGDPNDYPDPTAEVDDAEENDRPPA